MSVIYNDTNMEILTILLLIFGTWFLTYNLFYSPRAQIRRLLKQMFNIPIKLAKAKRKFNDKDDYFYDVCKKALELRYQVILALLNLYFDPEIDKEYIEQKQEHARAILNNVEKIMR